ncbi:hypothetical protein EJ110_NYTH43174 [Nymphaea thermarum]|nr:hypothetical protein EJ110_NYTH43174 [Nymphaea thermarum]
MNRRKGPFSSAFKLSDARERKRQKSSPPSQPAFAFPLSSGGINRILIVHFRFLIMVSAKHYTSYYCRLLLLCMKVCRRSLSRFVMRHRLLLFVLSIYTLDEKSLTFFQLIIIL